MKADVQTIAEVILTIVVVVSIVSFVVSYLGGMTMEQLEQQATIIVDPVNNTTYTSHPVDPSQVSSAYQQAFDATTKLTSVANIAIVVLIVGLFMGLLAIFRKNE